jgi:4-hydroxythreonine-4-phosphate dehydrogenase
MRAAIYAAIDVYRNRKNYDEAYRSPLRRQYFDKGPDNVVLDLTKDS